MHLNRQSLLRCALALSLVVAAAILMSAAKTHAKEEVEGSDPVFVFNRICYAQVPDVQRIRDMALRLAWRPIKGDDLQKFTTLKDPKVLEGWDVQVGERLYRVAITQSAPPDGMKRTFPEFEKGTSTTCTMVLDEGHDAETFNTNMRTLAGKDPVTKNVPEGSLLTTTWAGGNEDVKVFLFSKANIGGKGGLLNVTVLTR